MVFFTDHYNANSINRLPSKTKIGKDPRYFNNSLLCKPEFSSATKIWWEYTKSCVKENAEIFSKNSTTQENVTIS